MYKVEALKEASGRYFEACNSNMAVERTQAAPFEVSTLLQGPVSVTAEVQENTQVRDMSLSDLPLT
jgi:hypothetical protein